MCSLKGVSACRCFCGPSPHLLVLTARSKNEAVLCMLRSAGHVVALSGGTLFCTFILLLAFPQNFLQSLGWSCSIIVLSGLVVNLTLTPALLLSFDCLSFFDIVSSGAR